jgi:hypothetical protein
MLDKRDNFFSVISALFPVVKIEFLWPAMKLFFFGGDEHTYKAYSLRSSALPGVNCIYHFVNNFLEKNQIRSNQKVFGRNGD